MFKQFTVIIFICPFITSVYAANTAPFLLKPADKTKNIVKENIRFSWQKPADISDSKILSYRLLISTNSQFSGYRPKLDECDSHCSVSIVGASNTEFMADVERLKSVYFWKVQAITSTGSGRWSRIYSFKTTSTLPTSFTGKHLFDYTKIANDGSELSVDAKLGGNPKDWACTRDNTTGLMWEVKTDDDGLRDKDWNYSWYEPDANKNDGFEGYKRTYEYNDWCKGSECDIHDFTVTVNDGNLCGGNNWRVPTKDELSSLVYCSDNAYDAKNGACVNSNIDYPAIDKTYFPNTSPSDDSLDSIYWTFSSDFMDSKYAWDMSFTGGVSYSGIKRDSYYVRLVRNQK
jgi:hypothetical protein